MLLAKNLAMWTLSHIYYIIIVIQLVTLFHLVLIYLELRVIKDNDKTALSTFKLTFIIPSDIVNN